MPFRIAPQRNSESQLLQSLLPGTLASIVLHGLFIVVMFLTTRGCEEGVSADAGGREFYTLEFTTLTDGLVKQTELGSPTAEDSSPIQDGNIESVAEVDVAVPDHVHTINDELESTHLSPQDAPIKPSQAIGVGESLSPMDPPARLVPESDGGLPPGSPETPRPAPTDIMNMADSGQRFVYLLDISASMHNRGRMYLAQSQLLASLRVLQAHQEFQVIFYDDEPISMRLKNGAQEMYRATAANVMLAGDEIEAEGPGHGTNLVPALHAAFKLAPDVVYVLTDGQDTGLTVNDLWRVLKQNSVPARVHVIEFAEGPLESRRPNWLSLLTRKTGGEYIRELPRNRRSQSRR